MLTMFFLISFSRFKLVTRYNSEKDTMKFDKKRI
jgi:hypothetical protein